MTNTFERLYDQASERLLENARARGQAIATLESSVRSMDAYISVYLDFNLDSDKRTIQHLQERKAELQEVISVLRAEHL